MNRSQKDEERMQASMKRTRKIRNGGVSCKKCGCFHVPVITTRHAGSTTIRLRACRNCGHTFHSYEQVLEDK